MRDGFSMHFEDIKQKPSDKKQLKKIKKSNYSTYLVVTANTELINTCKHKFPASLETHADLKVTGWISSES